jgi:prepilin-type N-terminal cleavage/methylation domain-containing protein
VIHRTDRQRQTQTGFSMIELLVVIAIILVVGGLTVPGMVQTWRDIQLRSTTAEVADLMQQARMQAARANVSPGVPIRYQVTNGIQQVYADFNNNGVWDPNTEPIIDIPKIFAAPRAPNGGNGTPSAFVDTMDTTVGAPCDNTCTLAFSPRGLPCNLVGAVCTTPAASYFVYYFQGGGNGWSGVLVSKAGRSKVLVWNGTSWR